MLHFDRFQALTFDCYGTLIDWETGIWEALRPVLRRHHVSVARESALEMFGALEAEAERRPYRDYKTVLREVLQGVGRRAGFEPSDAECDAFSRSVGDWPAFPDSPAALARLERHFRLGVLTNCDDDLFAASNRRLGVEFDWIVTAQQARGYKPRMANFELLFERLALPRGRILHVAQSLFHDHVPAKALGLSTIRIDRRHGRPGSGATPPADASPDATFPDMASFADAAAGS
jgi:2-haloacid dehalogenase